MSDEPSSVVSLSIDEAQSVWSLVESRIDQFCAAWDEASQPPDISMFVGTHEMPIRRLILLDLIKIDLEFRWEKQHEVHAIDWYLDQWPELRVSGCAPAELLYEDIHQRRQHGEVVNVEAYLSDFPESADTVRRLVQIDAADVSTSLSHGRITQDFSVGDSIDDFELRVELGRGAFGVVFLALQRSMQRMVALKISANKGTEAQVLAQLDHPNIVRVYDRRIVEEKGLQLFYMQYIRGGTLYDALKYVRERPASEWSGRLLLDAIDKKLDDNGEVVPTPTPTRIALAQANWTKATCDFGIQLAAGLDYSHRKNTLHRDVKPANVLLTAEGVAKLADFNISCNSKLDGASPAAYFGGSLAYMSPEQLEAYNPNHAREPESLDARSDIYSTGIVIWEMLTGSRPFRDERLGATWETTLAEMTERRKRGLTESEWTLLPDTCPSALKTFLGRALQPQPKNRFSSAADMIRLLRIAGSSSAQGLVTGRRWWIQFARRHPYWVILLAAVVPNLLAAAFVYAYNHKAIESVERSTTTFFGTQLAVNGVFFPIGVAWVVYFTWPIGQTLRARRERQRIASDMLELARKRILHLGGLVVFLGISLWTIAGIAYAIALSGDLDPPQSFGLFASNFLGGLIAGTYPFFLITYVGLVAWYPTLLEYEMADDGSELEPLDQTSKRATLLTFLAGALPMLAVTFMVTWKTNLSEHQGDLGLLSAVSVFGFGALFWLAREIRERVEMLKSVLSNDHLGDRSHN